MLCSISCSDINKKIARNVYVAFRGFVQKFAPIRRGQRIPALPPSDSLFGYPKVRSKLLSAPRSDNFSIAVHATEYGKYYPLCQGIVYLYKSWIKRPYFIS